MGAQPAHQIKNVSIAPHPLRKSFEIAERFQSSLIFAATLNVAVDAERVRPISFPGDQSKAFLEDEPFGDFGPRFVELMRPVRRLAEQHVGGIPYELQQRAIIGARAGERVQW